MKKRNLPVKWNDVKTNRLFFYEKILKLLRETSVVEFALSKDKKKIRIQEVCDKLELFVELDKKEFEQFIQELIEIKERMTE